MSWCNELVLLLRHLINDLDTSDETYTDDRLEECIIAAAQFMITEIDFDQTYTLNIDEHSLSPDPTLAGSKDDDFINLTVLKAATIILKGESKKLAGQSYSVKDGSASIDIRGAYQSTKDLLDQMTQDLAISVQNYKAGNSIAGKAILTPYTNSFVNSRGSIF